MTDQRVIDVARILCGLRSALGLAPDGRACLIQAFGADDAALKELHGALGRVIEVAATDKQRARRRGTRRACRLRERA